MEEEKKDKAPDREWGRSRRLQAGPAEKSVRSRMLAAAGLLILLGAAACGFFYYRGMKTYEAAFFPNTAINGIDVSGKTVDEVKAAIEEGLSGYTLTIVERGQEEVITKEEIGLHAEFDGTLEMLLAEQEPVEWLRYIRTQTERQIETMLVFDEDLLAERLKNLNCLDATQMVEPENAKISEYQEDTQSYEILPATPGTEVIRENVERAVRNALTSLESQVNLEEEGCYTKAAVEADDEGLLTLAATLNQYVGTVVRYTFGDTTEVLDGGRIHEWLSVDGQTVTIDESQVAAYVKELADKYNTAYKTKTLKTTYGPEVTITKGNYGWRINEAKEAETLLTIIQSGEQQTREPEYLQTAASHGEHDYGNTYVEINLTAQHLYFYKDGALVVESDFVSGNAARGWSTPVGAYPLTYKQRNATLRGEGYATPVSYWMPFNGGVGMHDASWRGSFGGSIYKTNGSHGCINLPASVAKTIYENISAGDPVLCYQLEGTESSSTSKTTTTKKPAATTAAPETTAPATEAAPVTEAVPSAPETSAETPISPAGPGAPAETSPVSPENQGPGAPAETSPASPENQGPAAPEGAVVTEIVPAGPSVPAETMPEVTAGNDDTGFGPGFVTPAEEPQTTEPEIGPGYPGT